MTETDICNAALGAFGHDKTITSLDDGTTEAARCSLFLAPSRKAVLGSHDWNSFKIEPPAVAGTPSPDGRSYIFPYPSSAARICGVFDAKGLPVRFRIANGAILADEPEASVHWIQDVEDPALWPPAICDAVTYELAYRLSGPMTGKAATVSSMRQLAAQYLSIAKGLDANETRYCGDKGNRYADARN